MNIVKTICPECSASLEFPADFANVVCSVCGSSHRVREHNGTISLEVIRSGPAEWEDQSGARHVADRPEEAVKLDAPTLGELDELIGEIEADIEALRAREQSGPLQMGCAIFGVFGLVLSVIIIFMLVAQTMVGGPVFYAALALVTLLGIARVRAKLKGQTPISELQAERRRLEQMLAELHRDRARDAP